MKLIALRLLKVGLVLCKGGFRFTFGSYKKVRAVKFEEFSTVGNLFLHICCWLIINVPLNQEKKLAGCSVVIPDSFVVYYWWWQETSVTTAVIYLRFVISLVICRPYGNVSLWSGFWKFQYYINSTLCPKWFYRYTHVAKSKIIQ